MTPDLRDPNKAAEVRAMFDYSDGQLIRRETTSPRAQAGALAGTLNAHTGYRQVRFQGRIHLAHRLIFLWHHGWLPDEIDHINRDKSDNRIENLRAASRSQNNLNTGVASNNTSGAKGVYWSRVFKKWHARIWVNKQSICVGYFDDFEAAVFAREQENKLHNGEFAK